MSLEVAAFGFGHDFFMVWVTAKVLCDFFFFYYFQKTYRFIEIMEM